MPTTPPRFAPVFGDPTQLERAMNPSSSNLSSNISGRVPLPQTKAVKSQYTEAEVAEELRISVDALRKLIRSHVVDRDEDVGNIPATTFQPSDLLVLRLLAGMTPMR